jgi:23S rRNA (adenine2503-C2)-methyltransferase
MHRTRLRAPAVTPAIPPLARTPQDWTEALKPIGGRGFHAGQVFRWIQGRGVLDPERMTDLPRGLRASLAELDMPRTLEIAQEQRAADGTRKLLARMRDGATVEAVLIPGVTGPRGQLPSPVGSMEEGDDDEDDAAGDSPGGPVRVTQCISTQVGCAQGCVFCASGVAGLKRNLGADEIVAQVLAGRAHLDAGERLSNVVYMGMGEPLANYDATARSLQLLTHPDGIALSTRRITVSTSGLVPEIARLGADFGGKIGLAISLHAADDATRSRLMPINKKYPLARLMDALRAYPLPPRRRITIEYTLVSGKNDGTDEARKLVRLLRGLPVKVNLIPMNPIAASSLGPPEMGSVLAFQRILCDAGYSCFIRRRRGDDVAAACGQLALLGAKPKVRVNRA